MAIDSAVLLPNRGEETSHCLCGCVGRKNTHGADTTLKPMVSVNPPGPWMAVKVGVSEVHSSHSGVLIPNLPTCGSSSPGGPVCTELAIIPRG